MSTSPTEGRTAISAGDAAIRLTPAVSLYQTVLIGHEFHALKLHGERADLDSKPSVMILAHGDFSGRVADVDDPQGEGFAGRADKGEKPVGVAVNHQWGSDDLNRGVNDCLAVDRITDYPLDGSGALGLKGRRGNDRRGEKEEYG